MALFGKKDQNKPIEVTNGNLNADLSVKGEVKTEVIEANNKQLKSQNYLSPIDLCTFVNENNITPAWIVGTDHLHIVYYYA